MNNSELNDGGPAFPRVGAEYDAAQTGMSMRQHYKLKAFEKFVEHALGIARRKHENIVFSAIAKDAGCAADALLAEDAAWAKRQEENSDGTD